MDNLDLFKVEDDPELESYEDTNEDDPFSEYKHWDEKDAKKPGQDAPESKETFGDIAMPKRASKDKPFTLDEIKKLRDLAAKQAANIVVARNHYADPKKNPKMHREGHLQVAHNNAFSNMHDAWNEFSNSEQYRNASLPQKWKMQRDFKSNWHDQNPSHYAEAMGHLSGAHKKGELADLARLQEEKRRLEHSKMGGGIGTMTTQEAAAHLGSKAGEDEAPQVTTTQSAGAKFAASNPKAIEQALASKRFGSVPEEDVEVEHLSGRAPIKKHPDFDKPENKKLINDFAGRYAHLQNSDFVNKIKHQVGASTAQLDDAALSDAAHNAMWMAMHQHNAARSDIPLDKFIKNRMVDAIKNNIKAQHTEQTTASAKRAAKQTVKQDDPARMAGVKIYTPEERAALQAKMLGQPAPAATTPTQAPAQEIKPTSAATVENKPHFSEHLDDASKDRLKQATSAKAIVRGPGGQS